MAYSDYAKANYHLNHPVNGWQMQAFTTLEQQVLLDIDGYTNLPGNDKTDLKGWFCALNESINTAGNFVVLNENGQITVSMLPSAAMGGMIPKGNITTGETVDSILSRGTSPVTTVGDFVQVSVDMSLDDDTLGYDHTILPPGDAGDYTLPIELEAGDFLVLNEINILYPFQGVWDETESYSVDEAVYHCSAYFSSKVGSNLNQEPVSGTTNSYWTYLGTTKDVIGSVVWGITDNTVNLATTSTRGSVVLSDVSKVSGIGDNNDVITEDVLKDIINGVNGADADGLLKDSEFANGTPGTYFMKSDGNGGYSLDGVTYLNDQGDSMYGNFVFADPGVGTCAASHILQFIYRHHSNDTPGIVQITAHTDADSNGRAELVLAGQHTGTILTTANYKDYEEWLSGYAYPSSQEDVASNDTLLEALEKLAFMAKTAWGWGDHPDITTGTNPPSGGDANDVYIQQIA